MNKTKKRGIIKFISLSIIFIIFIHLIIKCNLINTDSRELYQYILTISSVMGGFMFAGLGILVSAIADESIRRFWNGYYLDNLYRASVFGLICDILSMILSSLILYIDKKTIMKVLNIESQEIITYILNNILGKISIILSFLGFIYFIWSIIVLIKVFGILKESKFK